MMPLGHVDCSLYVVGRLLEIPELKMDSRGELFAVVKLRTLSYPNKQTSVLVIENEALKIRQFGFIGLPLLIKCEYSENILVGKKLIFIDASPPGFETQQPLSGCGVTQNDLVQSVIH